MPILKVAGGVKLTEPAVDLSIIVATASSFKDQAVDGLDCFVGEVGLTGEVRRVSRIEQRVQEAAKLGFKELLFHRQILEVGHSQKASKSLVFHQYMKL